MDKKFVKTEIINRFRYINKPIMPQKLNKFINIIIQNLIKIVDFSIPNRTPETGKGCL